MKVDNAIILAAGTASRFVPLSYEIPKGLIQVKGEVLIERQIKQLQQAGITDIIIVTGYKSEQFAYLENKYAVKIIHNSEYLTKNNHASVYAVKDYLKNSYICSSDNYYTYNPFESEVDESYYSAVYVKGKTLEWCIVEENNWIMDINIGGYNAWIMLGHAFLSESFSKKYISILEQEYNKIETKEKLWEKIYLEHVNELPMRIRKYPSEYIFEFDTLDELRQFDTSYIKDTKSVILKDIARDLNVAETDITNLKVQKDKDDIAVGFTFSCGKKYEYCYRTKTMEEIN